ncbi:variable large family protein [Borrelia turicatae]|uniref:variable large family protein n=1 Tax=Borrelia turicatae TaxID=142 RepID=UPI000E5A92CE|nr:variable large family protein [Borrelia turicatae]
MQIQKDEGNAGATKTGEDKKDVGKLFADDNGKADAKEENIAKASASVGSVTGADILQAIAKSKEEPKADQGEGIEKATDAAEIAIAPAVANKKEIKEAETKKDAVIAAGIALRAMAKDGKFAANNNAKDAGNAVNAAANATDAIAVLGGHTAKASTGAGDKLAAPVSKADPWAMIDKIKNAKATAAAKLNAGTDNEAGVLAASNNNADAGAGAKSNADLAAAVALKAMTKGGKFSAAAGDKDIVKAAAASAVNKVLGVLDFIIRKTVVSNLDKIREAVKGIKYSETTTESTESSTTTQPAAK